jgi:hypothetical protein
LAIYVNKDNNFEQTEPTSRECPHCGAHTQLLPVATPSFEVLTKTRPKRVGLAFRCAACNEPRFVRAMVRRWENERVELSSNLVEIERTRERFPYDYLPKPVARLLREALECYAADCHTAFALMSRRAVQTAWPDLGKRGRLRWHELFQDAVRAGELDAVTTRRFERVLFGVDDAIPEIGAEQSAMLIEIVKDLFYQCYVRGTKLRAAMRMRRYFASGARALEHESRPGASMSPTEASMSPTEATSRTEASTSGPEASTTRAEASTLTAS